VSAAPLECHGICGMEHYQPLVGRMNAQSDTAITTAIGTMKNDRPTTSPAMDVNLVRTVNTSV